MTTVEILKAARKRIEDPEKWWNGAKDTNRAGINCAQTAIANVLDEDCDADEAARAATANCAYARLTDEGTYQSVWRFNDTHTHAEVLALFDRAIAAAEQETP